MLRVPFHLVPAPGPVAPAAAALVETNPGEVGPLADWLAKLGPGSDDGRATAVYLVAGGFLVVAGSGLTIPPGAIRLRRRPGANLWLPVDAELVPPLLDDEARALTRSRGLVFLPGGRVLAFDPDGEIDPAGLLVLSRRRPPVPWEPFPERPARPETLREIVRVVPTAAAQAILDPTGVDASEPAEGVATTGPERPEGRGLGSTLAGWAKLGVGRAAVGLGAILGSVSLARLGATWVARAVGQVPRLSETLFGKLEAAIRELLRQFSRGDTERALRHALPLSGDGGETPQGPRPVARGWQLPWQDPRYSLGRLLGSGGGRGPGAAWAVSDDLHAELARAYRQAAADAEAAGDFRRAAMIHGRLLGDLRRAAELLEKAGLFHDAAVLFRDRLSSPRDAARCLEAAGATDQALTLLRFGAFHREAGDLLRRLGEEEAAVDEYVQAAHLLAIGPPRDYMAAGDLLRDHARRPDLARSAYAQGWQNRPGSNDVACLLRMTRLHVDGGDADGLFPLIDEADAWFARRGNQPGANLFYNDLAGLADDPRLAPRRDDLRDRALLGLATQMRQAIATGSRPGPLVSTLLGRWSAWSADLVADAVHATATAAGLPLELDAGSRPAPRRITVSGYGHVTAACLAVVSGELLLAFDLGAIVAVDVATGEARPIPVGAGFGIARAISTSVDGQAIAAINDGAPRRLAVWRREPGPWAWRQEHAGYLMPKGTDRISPIVACGTRLVFRVCDETGLLTSHEVPRSLRRADLPLPIEHPHAVLLRADADRDHPDAIVLGGSDWVAVSPVRKSVRKFPLGWCPAESIAVSSLDVDSGHLEVAGVDDDRRVWWSGLNWGDATPASTSKSYSEGSSRYQGVALARPRLIAAMRRGKVDWLHAGPLRLLRSASTDLDIASVVAGFGNPRTGEVVVVGRDGTIACVPIPA